MRKQVFAGAGVARVVADQGDVHEAVRDRFPCRAPIMERGADGLRPQETGAAVFLKNRKPLGELSLVGPAGQENIEAFQARNRVEELLKGRAAKLRL